jgi:hypothetical protein
MDKKSLLALADYLYQHLEGLEDCDNKLTHTIGWLKRNGFDVEFCQMWLESYGGYCDCEVLLNVIPPNGDNEIALTA